jgi:triacylglycerol esterase/lipase EstA (alpha/beta hydrolase family)
VGINNIRSENGLKSEDFGPNLVRAVYGHQHVNENHTHHTQTYYKPRLLRQLRRADEKEHFIGYPDGIPGGWNSGRKIHFIGHSMGAQTVRYL